MTGSRMWSIER